MAIVSLKMFLQTIFLLVIRLFSDPDDPEEDDDYQQSSTSNIDMQSRVLSSQRVTLREEDRNLNSNFSQNNLLDISEVDDDDDDDTEAENAHFRKLQEKVDKYLETERLKEKDKQVKKNTFVGMYEGDIDMYQNQEGHPDVARLMYE